MPVMMLSLLNNRRGLFFGWRVPLPQSGAELTQAGTRVFHFLGGRFHLLVSPHGRRAGAPAWVPLSLPVDGAAPACADKLAHKNWLADVSESVRRRARRGGRHCSRQWHVIDVLLWIHDDVYRSAGVRHPQNRIVIAGIIASFIALVLVTCRGALAGLFTGTPVGWAGAHQITWIPVIFYRLVFALVWLLAGVAALIQRKVKTAKRR